MEEILASIRKIIAEDTNEPPPPPKQEARILELTQEVHQEPPQTQVAPPPPPPPPAREETELSAAFVEPELVSMTSAPSGSVDAESEPSTSTNEDTHVSSSAQALSHEGIFSDSTRQAIEQTFAGLDQVNVQRASEARPTASFAPVEGNSIEAVFERAVRASVDPGLQQWMDHHHDELLHAVKPLLRDWMDEHFPALLEGAVREEVARIIRARGR
ncbi:MAG TPA: DUF2497 domain-containing protein [Rhizomicrobium sp.]|nr:DUF2497 domain-containing protein [Rhizomicrobium sp.]